MGTEKLQDAYITQTQCLTHETNEALYVFKGEVQERFNTTQDDLEEILTFLAPSKSEGFPKERCRDARHRCEVTQAFRSDLSSKEPQLHSQTLTEAGQATSLDVARESFDIGRHLDDLVRKVDEASGSQAPQASYHAELRQRLTDLPQLVRGSKSGPPDCD